MFILETIQDFFDDKISADEAVELMQQKADLILNE
jgi:hypothetical protein